MSKLKMIFSSEPVTGLYQYSSTNAKVQRDLNKTKTHEWFVEAVDPTSHSVKLKFVDGNGGVQFKDAHYLVGTTIKPIGDVRLQNGTVSCYFGFDDNE